MPIGASMAAAAAAAGGKENTHCIGSGAHIWTDGQPRRIGRLISGAKMRREREREGEAERERDTGWGGVNVATTKQDDAIIEHIGDRVIRAGHSLHSIHNPLQRSPMLPAVHCTAVARGGT